jgi:hypothetical protein
VIRDEILTKQLERTFLHAQEQISLDDLINDLGIGSPAIEGADHVRAGK